MVRYFDHYLVMKMRNIVNYATVALETLLVLSAFAGCGELTENLNAEQQEVSEVEISPASITVKEGGSYTLTGTIRKWNATAGRTLVWSSDNETVAAVDENGIVTGIRIGETHIKASIDGKSASCLVTVVSSRVPAESVSIDRERLLIENGKSAVLSATVAPSGSTDEVVWSSSNPDIVNIDPYSGKATATGTGYADIFATAGDVSASVKVLARGNLWISQLDPLTKPVSFEDFDFETDTIRVARGETATVQFIVHAETSQGTLTPSVTRFSYEGSEGISLTPKIWWVRDVTASEHWDSWAGGPPPTRYPASQKKIPDALMPIEDWSVSLASGEKAALWIEIDIPRDAQPGIYIGLASVRGTDSVELPFSVQVYDVTLPEKQTLDVVHWINSDLSKMNGGESTEMHTVYSMLENTVIPFVSEYGTNSFKTLYFHRYETNPTLVKNNEGEFEMRADFSALGREIEMYFRACPDLHYVHGENIVGSRSNMSVTGLELDSDGKIIVTDNGNGTYTPNYVYVSQKDAGYSPEAEAYVSLYFAALQKYLESNTLPDGRSYLDVYLQTLFDEPQDDYADGYMHLASYARKGGPKVKIMDPLETSKISAESIDFACPGVFHLEGETGYNWSSGQTRWIYQCMSPQGNGLNRFIRIPLLPTRLSHWLNYRYNTTGFLHWGLNYWAGAKNGDPWEDAGGSYPAGDMWIIWPGYQKVYPSIRLAAMRDGIRDYELLRLLEQKSSAEASALCRRVVSDPYNYVSDVKTFRAERRTLLELLSQ